MANSSNVDEKDLEKRFRDSAARVGVMGLGYVGLPLAEAFAHAGFSVTGFDVDAGKAHLLNEGKTYIRHIPDSRIAAIVEAGRFHATADFRDWRTWTRF